MVSRTGRVRQDRARHVDGGGIEALERSIDLLAIPRQRSGVRWIFDLSQSRPRRGAGF
jgi:hypothetical protein